MKLKDKDKERLDQLRAKLLLAGVNLKQEELLSWLIDLGEHFLPGLDQLQMKKLSEEEKNHGKKIPTWREIRGNNRSGTLWREMNGHSP